MKLFLHIGPEKTGSSFLQSVFARNVDYLNSLQISFPMQGHAAKEMLADRISAGNGKELVNWLKNEEYDSIDVWLRRIINETKNTSILISSEILFECFSRPNRLHKFLGICKALKIELQPLLIFYRDPVEYGLSLYKHRSKVGKTGSIGDWLKSGGLHLPDHIDGFYKNMEGSGAKLHVIRYEKNTDVLLKGTFNDWLSIDFTKLKIPNSPVNISLTLSELAVIQQIKDRPWLVKQLYYKFYHLDKSLKARDKNFEITTKSQIEKVVEQRKDSFDLLNMELPKEKRFEFTFPKNERNIVPKIELSESQLKVVMFYLQKPNILDKYYLFKAFLVKCLRILRIV